MRVCGLTGRSGGNQRRALKFLQETREQLSAKCHSVTATESWKPRLFDTPAVTSAAVGARQAFNEKEVDWKFEITFYLDMLLRVQGCFFTETSTERMDKDIGLTRLGASTRAKANQTRGDRMSEQRSRSKSSERTRRRQRADQVRRGEAERGSRNHSSKNKEDPTSQRRAASLTSIECRKRRQSPCWCRSQTTRIPTGARAIGCLQTRAWSYRG